MRYEYTCACDVVIAHECPTDEMDVQLLESIHNTQVATHIANCRKALSNYQLREVTEDE